jgi:cysteine-rich repeat protein
MLEFWGGFSSGVARCQRAISRAAARCIGDVTAARQGCLTPALAGTVCDIQQLNTDVAALRQRVLSMVGPSCTSIQLQNLGYVDLSEAYRDIVDVCRRLDTATTSAVYAPALRGGVVSPVRPIVGACIHSTASASARLLEFSIRAHQRALDQIAAKRLDFRKKQGLLSRSAEQINRVRPALRRRIGTVCSDTDFVDAYGRHVESYLTGIQAQASCHGQYVYVQNAVLCPAIACGNGIQEPNEQCDDGNDVDVDGCRADCTRGECTVCAPTPSPGVVPSPTP